MVSAQHLISQKFRKQQTMMINTQAKLANKLERKQTEKLYHVVDKKGWGELRV